MVHALSMQSPHNSDAPQPSPSPASREGIAIVGIGCRLPGDANSAEAFWKLLAEGRDAIVEIPESRWNQRRFYSPIPQPGKSVSRWGGLVADIDLFDPILFGISPREAAKMDPQQRMLLEVAWRAMEDAGLPMARVAGTSVGVFVGISSWDYALAGLSVEDRSPIDAYNNTGSTLSIAANRISYCFDLRGPSLAVDTACSSSLMAIHLACESLWQGTSKLALAGGVNALLMPDSFVAFSQLGVLSPDGRCKTFDARADGYVRSEGAGMILLKPLADAIRDQDRIYAVIRGSATNQDGRTPGLTVPSPLAQQKLVEQACEQAGVSPSQIQYVEAHGTGTAIGDPIEAEALANAVGKNRTSSNACWVGSVKTNIGHLEAGAGVASTIKVALALHHRTIPPHLHFQSPHPKIDFQTNGLQLPLQSTSWPEPKGSRLAGVNGFGYGGANVHLILEEAPEPSRVDPHSNPTRPHLLTLSAKSVEGLHRYSDQVRDWLRTTTDLPSLANLAGHALHRGQHWDYRMAVVGTTVQEWEAELTRKSTNVERSKTLTGKPKGLDGLVFALSGQGPQWWGMGRGMFADLPVARTVLQACDDEFRRWGDWSLIEELHRDERQSRLQETAIAQPALFAIQVALGAYWEQVGIRPSAIVGHSVGEIAAAHLAGALNFADACCVAFHRGRTMDRVTSHGGMLAVGLSEREITPWLQQANGRLEISAKNGPQSLTLSGDKDAIEACDTALQAKGIFTRRLQVEYAFHSRQMDPIRDELLRALEAIQPTSPRIPIYSTVTGDFSVALRFDSQYWWQNVRQPVQFESAVRQIAKQRFHTVLELGPHPVLAFAVEECFGAENQPVVTLPSLRRQADDQFTLLQSAARLYELGYSIEGTGCEPLPQAWVQLPEYPFQKQRCWNETRLSRASRLNPSLHPMLGVRSGASQPSWDALLDLQLQPYFRDHLVRQIGVLPAAAVLEMGFSLGLHLQDTLASESTSVRISDFSLLNPCVLTPDRPKAIQTQYDPERRRIQIAIRDSQDESWVPLAVMQLSQATATTKQWGESVDAIRRRCPRVFSSQSVYDYCHRLGLQYGPAFRGIVEARQGDRECLVRIQLDSSLVPDQAEYGIHPALLDSCFHAMIVADPAFDHALDGLYLPSRIQDAVLHRPLSESLWVHARFLAKTPTRMRADLDVYDSEGELVASIRGFESTRLHSPRDLAVEEKLLYGYRWIAETESIAPPTIPMGEDWLIVGDYLGLQAELQQAAIAQGNTVTTWDWTPTAASPSTSTPFACMEYPAIEAQLAQWLTHASRPLRILYLPVLAAPDRDSWNSDSLTEFMQASIVGMRNFLRAWDALAADRTAKVMLLTRGAQELDEQDAPIHLMQAPWLGFGRVIGSEYNAWRTRLIDLPSLDAGDVNGEGSSRQVAGWVKAILEESWRGDDEDEVLYRHGKRFKSRFEPYATQPLPHTKVKASHFRLPIQRSGSVEELHFVSQSPQFLGPEQVEIQVQAAGLNFSDVMKSLGLYPGKRDDDQTLGAECAGVVSRIGDNVRHCHIGERVMAVAPGALASHVVVDQSLVVAIPSTISMHEAATIPIAFLTAVYALQECARLQPNERILIHAATGGVGMAALQVARSLKAIPLASAGTDSKRQLAKELGASVVVQSRNLAFADELRAQGIEEVDAVLNSLPGEAIPLGMQLLRPGGRFLEIGKRDIYAGNAIDLYPFRNNLSYFAIDLDQLFQTHSAYMGRLFEEVAGKIAKGEFAPIQHQVFTADQVVDAFRWMQQGKHVGKIVVDFTNPPKTIYPGDAAPLQLDPKGTYWIIGGLGGFGLEVAKWLVSRGARSLVLTNRRQEVSEEIRLVLETLRHQGVRIEILAGDITSLTETRRLVASIESQLPPLRGVFHCAMVLKDQLLLDLDETILQQVLAPKIAGGWNLHLATEHCDLQHFVLFSSLSSVFGHAGQGNYAAANAFLDGLARYRRSRNLPSLVLNWGHLGEVGYLAQRHELSDRLERQGVLRFSVDEAMQCLEFAMSHAELQVSVLNMDWSLWRGLGVTSHVSPRFAHLLQNQPATDSARNIQSKSLSHVRMEGEAACRDYFQTHLANKLAQLLGMDANKIRIETPLLDMGLDSLMAVELRNWMQSSFELNLPIASLMRNANIDSIAQALAEKALASTEASVSHREQTPWLAEPTDSPLSMEQAKEILDQLGEMSEEEVDRWLMRLQAEGLLPTDLGFQTG